MNMSLQEPDVQDKPVPDPVPLPASRLDLKYKIFLFNLILIAVVLSVELFFDLRRLNNRTEQDLDRKVQTIAKMLEGVLPTLIENNDRERMNDIVRKLTSPDITDNEINSITLLDPHLKQLAHSSQSPEFREHVRMRGPAAVPVRMPIRPPGASEPVGFLRISMSTEKLTRDGIALLTEKLILGLFFCVFAFGWSWLLARMINKPLKFLVEATNRISAGEMGTRIDDAPLDEFGVLITSFNKMTDTITVHLEEMRTKNAQLDKRVFELSTLHQASRAINSVLNLDQLYECIVDTTISVLGGVKRCSLMLVDRRSEEFVIKVAKGLDVGLLPSTRRVEIDTGVAGRVFSSGEPLILNDIPDEGDTRLLESTSVTRSSLIVPLKRNEDVIGIISASNKISGDPFSAKDQNMLESLAVQASVAIKNAKLYQDLNRKILELNTLHEVGKSLSMVLDQEKLLEMILEMTARVLGGVKSSSLILKDEESNTLTVKVYKGIYPKRAQKPIQVGEGIAGKVFERGEPMMINNMGTDDEESEFPTLVKEGYLPRSSLCVPLRVKDTTVGVLSVSDKLSGENFEDNDLHMLMTLGSQIAITLNNAQLYEDLEASYLSAVRALANSLDAKDAYTRGHSERVALYSMEIGQTMKLDPEMLKTLHIGAMLHDIGKIGISETIINKTARLDHDEFELIKTHPVRGAAIIEPAKFLRAKVPLIKHHHERMDGKGYPDGLAGENIPLLARIVCVADSYDAMTSKRAYRDPIPREEAVKELVKCSGSQFDPKVVTAFLEVLTNVDRMKEIETLEEQ